VAFTPVTYPNYDIVAAILYTPKVSGVVQVNALLDLQNGATPETYGLVATVYDGPGLTVTGGASTSNGWVIGSTVPPIIGGTPNVNQILGGAQVALGANALGNLSITGVISQPLPVGVPVVIEILLNQIGGGHPLAAELFTSLSILELP